MELQAALAAYASNVFPGIDWSAKIPKEILMESTLFDSLVKEVVAKASAEAGAKARAEGLAAGHAAGHAEGHAEGQILLLAAQLRGRLGKASERLIDRLSRCDGPGLLTVGQLLVRSDVSVTELEALLDRTLPPT